MTYTTVQERLIIKENNYCDNFEMKTHAIIFGSSCGICTLLVLFSILNWIVTMYINLNIILNTNTCTNSNGISPGCVLLTSELLFLLEIMLFAIMIYFCIIISRLIYRCIIYHKTSQMIQKQLLQQQLQQQQIEEITV